MPGFAEPLGTTDGNTSLKIFPGAQTAETYMGVLERVSREQGAGSEEPEVRGQRSEVRDQSGTRESEV